MCYEFITDDGKRELWHEVSNGRFVWVCALCFEELTEEQLTCPVCNYEGVNEDVL